MNDWRDVAEQILVVVADDEPAEDVVDAELVDEPAMPKQNRRALPSAEAARDDAMEAREAARVKRARMVRRRK